MSKKKEPASACASKCDKASKKTSKRITIPAYIDYLDELLENTGDDIQDHQDDLSFMLGVYEGFSAVKRHLQELSK